jgi:tol-pal system protein YbgF
LLLCACWFPQDRGQRLEKRIDRIEEEGPTRQLDQERGAMEERARKVDVKIAEIQKKLDALETGSHGAEPGGVARRDELAAELGGLRATLDQQGRRLDTIEKALAQARSGAGNRAAERRTASGRAMEHRPAGAPEVPRTRAPPEAPREKTGFLAFAREQEGKGEKAVARDLYQEYVQKFPDDPQAAEAHFRLGELAFGDRRYQDAIASFGKVAKDFPASERAPAALLRTAEAMLALDLKDDAISLLTEIPKRYPGTPAAKRARQHLSELSGSSAPASKKRN